MRYFVFGLGVLAAFALMIAGGWMNWRFISSLGADAADQQALGLASLGVDAMKPALAYLMALAWDKRQWGYVGVGVVTYALLAAMSLASSFGFSAEGRDAVMSARQALTAHYRAAATELGEIESRLKAYGPAKASSILASEVAGLEKEPRWRLTRSCAVIRGAANAEFCKGYAEQSTALTRAGAVETLESRRDELRKTLAELRDKGALRAADRRTMHAAMLGLREETLRNSLMLLLALVMEVGAGMGLYIALRPLAEGRRAMGKPDMGGHLTWDNRWPVGKAAAADADPPPRKKSAQRGPWPRIGSAAQGGAEPK